MQLDAALCYIPLMRNIIFTFCYKLCLRPHFCTEVVDMSPYMMISKGNYFINQFYCVELSLKCKYLKSYSEGIFGVFNHF